MPSTSEHVGHPQGSYHLPVDTLVLRPNNTEHPSLLDTVFTSRKTRRAAYATTTKGSETRVWKVDSRTGEMEEIAMIGWDVPIAVSRCPPGDGLRSVQMRSKRAIMISHGGRTIAMDDFLRKAKGWFPSDSKTFTSPVNDMPYKWKLGPERTNIPDATRRNNAYPHPDIWKRWRCVTASGAPHPTARSSFTSSASPLGHAGPRQSLRGNHNTVPLSPVPSYRSTSSDNSNPLGDTFPLALRSLLREPAPSSLLARFAPPQPGLLNYELTLFPPAYPPYTPTPDGVVDTIVVTSVLLATDKHEWRTRQSIIDTQSLAVHFEAEARGVIPPYTPRAPRTIGRSGRPRTAEERVMDQYVLTMNGTLRPLPRYQRPSVPSPSTPDAVSIGLTSIENRSDSDQERLLRYAPLPDSGRGRSGSASASSPPRWLPRGSAWMSQRRPRTAQGLERERPSTPPPSYTRLEA